MTKRTAEGYLDFLRAHLVHMNGNKISKSRFKRWVADTYGMDPRTYRRNCGAMMMLGLLSDGGAYWLIPEGVFKELETEFVERGGAYD